MMMNTRLFSGVTLLCAGALAMTAIAQEPARPPAERRDAVATILDAFRDHPIVALGEGPHGNIAGHAFRLALLGDPRFASVVNDIVVESGSARYQAGVDAFVLGETAADDTVRDAPIVGYACSWAIRQSTGRR
jgi:hypothetical protein